MVFKVVGGQPGPAGYIYQLWKSNDSLNEDLTNVLGISRSFPIPYKNRLVSSWQTTKPKEVKTNWNLQGWSYNMKINFAGHKHDTNRNQNRAMLY